MKIHYREVIEHDIEINVEAVIATWKKIIEGYTIDNDWPNGVEIDEILEDAFNDVLYCAPPGQNDDYFQLDGNGWWLNILEVDDDYGTAVTGTCENAVAEYLRYWGLLP